MSVRQRRQPNGRPHWKHTGARSAPGVANRRLPLIEAAVEQTTDGILITDAELDPPGPRIVYSNPALSAQSGYSAAELLGRSPRILQGPASDRAELDRVRRALQDGLPYQGEIINYRKDGQTYHLRWHLAPVRDAAGAITNWVAIQRDIGAEKAAAAERAALYEHAQLALRLRDDLLNAVAHELRTPVTALVGYTQLLRSAAEEKRQPEQFARFAALVAQQAQRLTALIAELLDLERLQAGALPLAQRPVDLAALTTDVTAAWGERLPPTHTLHVEVTPTQLPAMGDDVRLRHVLEELLGNALAFSPDGGAITVRLAREGDAIVLSVQDTGIGIPEAAVPHVWERFYRARNIDTLAIPGFGVGLFAIHEIITRHGGSIDVHSREGHGSMFVVRLPLHTEAA